MAWVQYEIRSRWLAGNLMLAALKFLRESPLAERELADSAQRSFGLAPNRGELGKILTFLVTKGFLERDGKNDRLRMTRTGMNLLQELEKEFETIASHLQREYSQ